MMNPVEVHDIRDNYVACIIMMHVRSTPVIRQINLVQLIIVEHRLLNLQNVQNYINLVDNIFNLNEKLRFLGHVQKLLN